MAKSFKKAIACLLAVLMVAFSMPFTAFADTAKPNLDVQFGTLYDYDSGLPNDIGTAGAGISFDYSGLYDSPLTADITKNADGSITINSLTLTKAHADLSDEFNERDEATLDSDWVLGEGDYFTMTFVCKNLAHFKGITSYIAYSNNIEPAGLYSYKEKKTTKYAFGSESERAAANTGTWIKGGTMTIGYQSASGIYSNAEDYNADVPDAGAVAMTTNSKITVADDEYLMYVVANSADGLAVDCSSTVSPGVDDWVYFANPETGDFEGYTYENTAIVCTFGFKIVGDISEGITLRVADPTTTLGGAIGVDSTSKENFITYGANDVSADPEHNVNGMLTFGMNSNSGEGIGGDTPVEHTHTYGDWTFDWTDLENVTCTRTCTADDCTGGDDATQTATVVVEAGDDTATCEDAGTITYTATATFNDVEVATDTHDVETEALGHAYEETPVAATCTHGSYIHYVCSRCQDEYDGEEADDMLDHDYSVVFNWGEVTVDSASATYTATCENCDFYDEGDAEITVSDDETKTYPATTSAPGKKTYIASAYGASEENSVDIPQLEKEYEFVEFEFAENGKTAKAVYANVEDATDVVKYDAEVTPAVAEGDEATCEGMGYTTYTASYDGHTDTKRVQDIPASGHDYGAWTFVWNAEGNDATCTSTCGNCSDVREATVTVVPGANTATCEEAGTITYTATATFNEVEVATDDNTVDTEALGHDFSVVVDEGKAATKTEDGYEAIYECSHGCGQTIGGAPIEATGLNITVGQFDCGTVTKDGEVYTTGASKTEQVKYGDSYTYTAEAADGASFVGWFVGKKLVSEEATYTNVAYADVTITPVFAEDKADDITVVYYDKYGNVIFKYEGAAEEFTPLAKEAVPALAGYTCTGFSMSDEEIAALKTEAKSATIFAKYDKVATGAYTVTVLDGDNDPVNAEITAVSGNVNGAFVYDDYVTVTAQGAYGFKIGEKYVAYGDSYSFYIGSDVTLTADYNDSIVAEPSVNITGYTKIEGSNRYNVIASRVTAGWTVIDRGFMCGANTSDDAYADIDAPGNGVKVSHGKDAAEFGIIWSASAGKTIRNRAYIVVKKGNTTKVVYSDIFDVVTA